MLKKSAPLVAPLLLCVLPAFAQTGGENSNVKINYLNVCTPSADDQHELEAALGRIPQHPKFSPDFEISRGRTTMSDAPMSALGIQTPEAGSQANAEPSRWVRLRRDFPQDAPYISVQYAMSVSSSGISETLVLRSRDVKNDIQTSLEDRISAASSPAEVLRTDTPVDRIRVERFGKSSIVLARCESADQSAYNALFTQGSAILERYRSILNVRGSVLADLARVGATSKSATGTTKSSPAKPATPAPQTPKQP